MMGTVGRIKGGKGGKQYLCVSASLGKCEGFQGFERQGKQGRHFPRTREKRKRVDGFMYLFGSYVTQEIILPSLPKCQNLIVSHYGSKVFYREASKKYPSLASLASLTVDFQGE